jgi:hypothetical protein
MSQRSRTYGCDKCRPGPSEAVEQVGDLERNTDFGGKAYEVVTHFRCKYCGVDWDQVDEGGISKGKFWNPSRS